MKGQALMLQERIKNIFIIDYGKPKVSGEKK